MNIPIRIDPCPIHEAIVEIRFETDWPGEAVFGTTYGKIKDRFPVLEKLPIIQIPEYFRSQDENLLFQPHYKLLGDSFLVQISPKAIGVVACQPYPGWSKYLPVIEGVFNDIHKLGFISQVRRIGLRYIDVFELDIFHNICLKVIWEPDTLLGNPKRFHTILTENGYETTLQIGNNAKINSGKEQKQVSVVDIDTSSQTQDLTFFSNMKEVLNNAHLIQKRIFFSLLAPDFLATLNPVYEE